MIATQIHLLLSKINLLQNPCLWKQLALAGGEKKKAGCVEDGRMEGDLQKWEVGIRSREAVKHKTARVKTFAK